MISFEEIKASLSFYNFKILDKAVKECDHGTHPLNRFNWIYQKIFVGNVSLSVTEFTRWSVSSIFPIKKLVSFVLNSLPPINLWRESFDHHRKQPHKFGIDFASGNGERSYFGRTRRWVGSPWYKSIISFPKPWTIWHELIK